MPKLKSWPGSALRFRRLDVSLLAETILVPIAAICSVRILVSGYVGGAHWFVTPAILISAALIPTVLRGNKFVHTGFGIEQIGATLSVVGRTCFLVFPAMLCGMWALKGCGFALPLRPAPQGRPVLAWLFYQFMYVAVAEEIFFRGYLQGNILKLTAAAVQERTESRAWVSIVLSAACFAAAHVLIQGQIVSMVTFLPGLIFGWLFVRTKSLLAPILFHGLANTVYFVAAAVLF
ncbi:MAG: CPBP family glutamic-type intramembrane protease [Planctomycetota bacterium]